MGSAPQLETGIRVSAIQRDIGRQESLVQDAQSLVGGFNFAAVGWMPMFTSIFFSTLFLAVSPSFLPFFRSPEIMHRLLDTVSDFTYF